MSHDDMMPSTLDREISKVEQDAFGHRHFAHALRSLIESGNHPTPFSIGLLGGWGTGKSSIKELYTAELRDDARKGHGLTREQRFHCITFNAWRFGGRDQDIKRALLRHVFLELGGAEENLHDKLFRQISETREVPKPWHRVTWEILKAWALPIPALFLAMAALLFICYLTISAFKVEDTYLRSVIFICITGAYTYLLKHLKPPTVSANRPMTKVALPSTTSEQYEDMLLGQIRQYKSGKSKSPEGKCGKTCERLVVFVDDLDRLSADEMILGLDAVRTFMEIPRTRLPDGLGLVFVISCDEAKIADALAKGRRHAESPATVFNHYDARRYLDRIFQFRLEIPPPPRHDMRTFATNHLDSLTSISEDLKVRGVPLAPIIDRMIHVGVQDPRNALQIVNAFAQAWWIAKKREIEGLGTDRPGGLHEGAVTKHPISLGALCAMKVSFPDFYRDLQEDPAFLHRFTDVVIKNQALDSLPLPSQQTLLEKYLRVSNGKDDVLNKVELRPEHRPLRQFIASLIGLRWADPLQSLLLLSEDPITRRLGSKVSAIYGSFVSGDTKGLLEGMGRHNDTSPLTPEQARTLYQMFEDLRQESPIRRTNAARVIADMIERIPEPPAQQLLGALCREISDTPDLRSQLGPTRIRMILSRASGVDQQVVASRLVDDALTSGKEMSLRLESLETASLEEAIEMVRITAPLVLSVRTEQGLEPSAEKSLLDWLVDRTIVVKSKSFQLPFNELEQWLHEYQDSLSSALGIRYLSALADELEKDDPSTFDIAAAAGRASRIFIELLPIGEETRRNLWKLLVRYVGLSQVDAVRAVWEVTARNLDKATDGEVSDFVTTFVERIKKFPNDGRWDIDREEVAAPLLDIVAARLSALDGTATSELADLADQWSRDPALATLSCEIVKQLRMRDVAAASRVLDAWAPLIISTLPIECVKFLATSFPALQGSTQTAVASAFSTILNNEQLSDDINKRYGAFVKAAPSSSWEVEPLRGYLDKLLPQIAVRYNNPSSYLYAVIPNTVGLLKHATSSVLGTSLQQLFSQAKSTPKHYSWLHHWMTGNWPVRSDALTSYDPQLIFDEAHTFALTQAASSTKGILRSMADMLERELVPAENHPKLIEAACSIWAAAPQHALDIFTSERAALSADQAANLLTPIDWTSQDHISALQSAWSNITKMMIDQARTDTSMRILAKGPIGTEAEPDLALRTWLEAQPDSGTALLTSLITGQDIGDVHRSRLWKQAVSRARILGSKFFLEVVPRIVVMPSIDETAAVLFDDHEAISEVLGDTDNRSEMAQSLMTAFTEAKTNTIKGRIAAYCNRLTGSGALKQFKPNELNKSDIELLETHFGGSPELRRLRKLIPEN
ncbi:KAP family P-loop NTPase fold protein [Pseudomonas fluorescens]|uniref:KAP family P-loop NTPase fold protein n=1 Tax=Pseudomonas fluorescens TaxID=294 RepID=UPI003D073C78